MPKEKGHGEGQIRERRTKAGKKYFEGALQVGTAADGSRRMFYCSGRTKAEVRDKFAEALRLERQGELVIGPKPTLAEFAAEWFARLHPPLAAATLSSYERSFRLHVAPELGHLRLDRLAPVHLQSLYHRALGAGTGARTVQLCHAFLHRLLRDAVRWGYLGRNVADADLVDRPRVSKRPRRSLSQAEAQRFVAALRGEPLEALYLLAVATGIRQGELLALHWSDVDWEAATLSVRRSLARTRERELSEKDPKSEAGERTLPLIEPVLAALRRHRARQLEQRLGAGADWRDRDLIFCTGHGGPLDRYFVYKRCFLPFLERAGVGRLTFHELRHSAATLLLHLGVPVNVVQEILGHSDVTTTLGIYGHVLPGAKREALEKLGSLLTGQS